MKHLKLESISIEVIDSIRKDRKILSIDELIYKYNVSAVNIRKICKGIERQREQTGEAKNPKP